MPVIGSVCSFSQGGRFVNVQLNGPSPPSAIHAHDWGTPARMATSGCSGPHRTVTVTGAGTSPGAGSSAGARVTTDTKDVRSLGTAGVVGRDSVGMFPT